MVEVGHRGGCLRTAAPVLLHDVLHWSQASSSQKMGVMTSKHSRHHKLLPMQHLGAAIAGLRQTGRYRECSQVLLFCYDSHLKHDLQI